MERVHQGCRCFTQATNLPEQHCVNLPGKFLASCASINGWSNWAQQFSQHPVPGVQHWGLLPPPEVQDQEFGELLNLTPAEATKSLNEIVCKHEITHLHDGNFTSYVAGSGCPPKYMG